jgi:hypothetical protein
VLRKGYEWEYFQLLANSKMLDKGWCAYMGGEIWKGKERIRFQNQKMYLLEIYDPKKIEKREAKQRQMEESWQKHSGMPKGSVGSTMRPEVPREDVRWEPAEKEEDFTIWVRFSGKLLGSLINK